MWVFLGFLLYFLGMSCSSELDLNSDQPQNQTTWEQSKKKLEPKKSEPSPDKESRTISEPVMVGGTFLVNCQILESDGSQPVIVGCDNSEDSGVDSHQSVILVINKDIEFIAYPIADYNGNWDLIYQLDSSSVDDADTLTDVITNGEGLLLVQPDPE